MTSENRLWAWWVLMAILLVVVYVPVLTSGPVGEDFPVLVESSRAVHPELGGEADSGADLFYDREGTGGRPLAALSLGTTSWIWTSGGVWTPFALFGLRLENLILLLTGAFFLGHFVRRLVVPWTGSEQADASRFAAWMILSLHPLSVSAVASPAARGDLLGGLLAAAAGTVFLRGRQERNVLLVALAAVLTLATTLASELGYLLPVGLAVIEYYSSRRYRPGRVRLRTALTTGLVFSLFAGLDMALRAAQDLSIWPRDLMRSVGVFGDIGSFWSALLGGFEKLGVLIIPVNGGGFAGIGYVLAVLIIVLVLQPALHAGRSAPRFWVTVLTGWLVLVVMTEAMRATLVVYPGDFSCAARLYPAVLVMAIGLSLGATAVTGVRRYGFPVVIALLFSVLARSNALGLAAAADEGRVFTTEIGMVIAEGGRRQRYLIVDPPENTRAHAVVPGELEWMFDPAVGGRSSPAEELWVRPAQAAAILSLAREPEFDTLREVGLTVVLPADRIPSASPTSWVSQRFVSSAETPDVLSWRNVSPDLADDDSRFGRGHWSGADGAVPFLADSAGIEHITVDAPADTPTHGPPEIYWRARGGLAHGGTLVGIWTEGPNGLRAVFDPGTSLAWLLGPRIDSLLLMGHLADTAGAEVYAAPPPVPGVTEPALDEDEEDWVFQPTSSELIRPLGGEELWILTLLDLEGYAYAEIECEFEEAEPGDEDDEAFVPDGFWIAPDAAGLATSLRRRKGGLAWALERRIEGQIIERSRGRF
jgi:hypothetical protein